MHKDCQGQRKLAAGHAPNYSPSEIRRACTTSKLQTCPAGLHLMPGFLESLPCCQDLSISTMPSRNPMPILTVQRLVTSTHDSSSVLVDEVPPGRLVRPLELRAARRPAILPQAYWTDKAANSHTQYNCGACRLYQQACVALCEREHSAFQAVLSHAARIGVMPLLLQHTNRVGPNLLFLAVDCMSAVETQALLAHGASPHEPGPLGCTPLQRACQPCNAACEEEELLQCLASLLDAGARVHGADAVGNTALHNAARYGLPAHVHALIGAGASVREVRAVDGTTPLHWAAAYGHTSVVELLLMHGASATCADRQQRSAIQLARTHGHSCLADAMTGWHDRGWETWCRRSKAATDDAGAADVVGAARATPGHAALFALPTDVLAVIYDFLVAR